MEEKISLSALSRRESQLLRGIAILLVLLGHTEYIKWGGAGGVGIFLLLSGYGLNESVKSGGLKRYWYKRFRTVWLPYFFTAVYGLVVFGFTSIKQVIVTLLGLDFKLNIDSTMWYITYILFWYIVFYVIELLCRALRLRGAAEAIVKILLLLAATNLCWLMADKTRVFSLRQHHDVLTYRLMFPLGVCMSLLSGIRLKKPVWTFAWTAVMCLGIMYFFRRYLYEYYELAVIAITLACVGFVKIVRLSEKAEKVLLWFGKYAFAIYLFEGGILYRRYEIFYMTDTALMTNIAFYLYSIGMAYLFWNYVLIPVRSKIDRAVGFTGSDRPAQLEEEHGKETDTAV